MSNRIIAGIDIGSTKISAVIAVVEGDSKPRVIGEASYPSGGIKKGEITGIDEAMNAIASALSGAERMAGLTVSSVYVSLNGKHIISNNNRGVVAVADSEINADDLFRAMEQAKTVAIPPAREIIHLIPREFIVDSQTGVKDPVGMTGTRLEVDAHIISATSTALHNLCKCIQSIGLRIDGEVFTGWSAAQTVLTPTEKELGVLLLDFGGGTTSVTTFEEGAVTYSTSIPLGGANVTRDLAAGLRLSLDDAEKVKINVEKLMKSQPVKEAKDDKKEEGEKDAESKRDILDVSELDIEGVKTISRKMFNLIVEERVKEIFELVRENLMQAGYQFKLPAGVVVTGGSAELPGVTAIAREVFGVPARVGTPRGLEGLVDDISSPAYAATQGLILYGLTDEGFSAARTKPVTGKKDVAGMADKVTKFFKNLIP
ncbi:MAG: cell division protein FtsA [Candidatus Doudnabacteria bacterium]|nr:cell division protein FtsA [Candidatus Doudnabacteria bacterium]